MGEGEETWKDTLPDDIKSHPSLESFQGVEDLAKSWVEAQKLIGKDKVPVPSSPDDKESWDLVFSRLGRPEDPKSYEIDVNEIPEEIPVDEDFLENFKVKAHEVGLLPGQVNELFNWWVNEEKGILDELQEKTLGDAQQAEAALRKEWGRAYDQNISMVKTVIKKFGGEDAQHLMESSFANDPAVLKMISKMAKAFSEDQLEGVPSGLTLTPAEAMQEISNIRQNEKHPFYDETHPEHQAAVERMQTLYKLAYPEG